MQSLKRIMRGAAVVSVGILALTFGYRATAEDLRTSPGSTVNAPSAPDVSEGYRPDSARKTLGEMERDLAEGKYDSRPAMPVQPSRAGDMNRPATTSGSYGSTGSGGLRDGAFADSAADLKVERVRVEDLSPELRAAVNSRMDRQQNPSELVETTILNRVALLGSEFKLESARQVGNDYVLRISDPDGQQATLLYETRSDTLREVQV